MIKLNIYYSCLILQNEPICNRMSVTGYNIRLNFNT